MPNKAFSVREEIPTQREPAQKEKARTDAYTGRRLQSLHTSRQEDMHGRVPPPCLILLSDKSKRPRLWGLDSKQTSFSTVIQVLETDFGDSISQFPVKW